MLHKLRARVQDEKGFTLIELLVVILIIGILAAIALPAFLNQREKAQDSEAKTGARTAQTALETLFTDNQSYADRRRRPRSSPSSRPSASSATRLTVAADRRHGYTVTVTSKAHQRPHLGHHPRRADGTVTRTCAGGTGGAPARAGGNSW